MSVRLPSNFFVSYFSLKAVHVFFLDLSFVFFIGGFFTSINSSVEFRRRVLCIADFLCSQHRTIEIPAISLERFDALRGI